MEIAPMNEANADGISYVIDSSGPDDSFLDVKRIAYVAISAADEAHLDGRVRCFTNLPLRLQLCS